MVGVLRALLLALVVATCRATTEKNVHPDNYAKAVKGKRALFWFTSSADAANPALVEAWARLGEDYAAHEAVVLGKVDCDGLGKPICGYMGIKKGPTLAFGSPWDLRPYASGATYEDLAFLVREALVPPCASDDRQWCTAKELAKLAEYEALSDDHLGALERATEISVDARRALIKDDFAAKVAEVTKLKKARRLMADARASPFVDLRKLLRGVLEEKARAPCAARARRTCSSAQLAQLAAFEAMPDADLGALINRTEAAVEAERAAAAAAADADFAAKVADLAARRAEAKAAREAKAAPFETTRGLLGDALAAKLAEAGLDSNATAAAEELTPGEIRANILNSIDHEALKREVAYLKEFYGAAAKRPETTGNYHAE